MKLRVRSICRSILVAVFCIVCCSCTEEKNVVDCLYEGNSLECANNYFVREMDRIEVGVTGRTSQVPMSKFVEEVGSFVFEGVRDIFGDEDEENEEDGAIDEKGRGKKLGKKKKKMLNKLFMLGMMLKSKLSFFLQLFHAHLQVKFFIVAVLGLLINAGRLWLEIKKSSTPAKVIYHEHSQHQHHYDTEDEVGGYWARSFEKDPQNLAYSAHVPTSYSE